jgi:hypothetical protein
MPSSSNLNIFFPQVSTVSDEHSYAISSSLTFTSSFLTSTSCSSVLTRVSSIFTLFIVDEFAVPHDLLVLALQACLEAVDRVADVRKRGSGCGSAEDLAEYLELADEFGCDLVHFQYKLQRFEGIAAGEVIYDVDFGIGVAVRHGYGVVNGGFATEVSMCSHSVLLDTTHKVWLL